MLGRQYSESDFLMDSIKLSLMETCRLKLKRLTWSFAQLLIQIAYSSTSSKSKTMLHQRTRLADCPESQNASSSSNLPYFTVHLTVRDASDATLSQFLLSIQLSRLTSSLILMLSALCCLEKPYRGSSLCKTLKLASK